MPPPTDAFTRRLLAAGALAALLPATASAIGLLNDTGQTRCVDASGAAWAANCNSASTGGLAGQDGRFGRDAAAQAPGQLTKAGGGVAGFDFTAIDASGQATTDLDSHACVYDHVTGLLWSTETLAPNSYADAVAAGATYKRCGHDGDWRLPSRRELLSIVHYGATAAPMIDHAYFPGTGNGYYWTANEAEPDPEYVWRIHFGTGLSGNAPKTETVPPVFVRLVLRPRVVAP